MESNTNTLVEYIHSSEIIEFFFFLMILLIFIMTCIRILKYHDNFNISDENETIIQNKPQPIAVPEKEAIKDLEKKQKENNTNAHIAKNEENDENEKKEKKEEVPVIISAGIKNDMNGSNVVLGIYEVLKK